MGAPEWVDVFPIKNGGYSSKLWLVLLEGDAEI